MRCYMCKELHGSDTCVTGCYYAALVAQGVVNQVQLAEVCSFFQPTFIHRQMTESPPEDRDCMIHSFLYHYNAHCLDPLRGVQGILDHLSAELAEKKAEVLKLEAQLFQLKMAHSERFATEMVSEELKLEAGLAELELALKVAEMEVEVSKAEDRIIEHKFRCCGRRRRGNEQII